MESDLQSDSETASKVPVRLSLSEFNPYCIDGESNSQPAFFELLKVIRNTKK